MTTGTGRGSQFDMHPAASRGPRSALREKGDSSRAERCAKPRTPTVYSGGRRASAGFARIQAADNTRTRAGSRSRSTCGFARRCSGVVGAHDHAASFRSPSACPTDFGLVNSMFSDAKAL